MIQYNEYNLLHPSPEQMEWLNRYLSPEDLLALVPPLLSTTNRTSSRNRNGYSVVGISRASEVFPLRPRINTLYWPSGASRWAVGYFLARKDVVQNVTDNPPPSTGRDLILKDESRPNGVVTITTKMLPLPPRKLAAIPGESQELWLLPLVDIRYYWQMRDCGDFVVEAGDTWEDVVSDLGVALGTTLNISAVDSYYLFPDPHELTRKYENAAVILDAVAHSIGKRVVRRLDGTVTLQGYDEGGGGDANSTLSTNSESYVPWERIAGDDFTPKKDPIYDHFTKAESVQVVFPEYVGSAQSCGHYSSVVPTNIKGAISGTVKTIFSTAAARVATNGATPSNQADLDALATKIRDDYRASLRHYDIAFAGLKRWDLCAFDDSVEYQLSNLRQTEYGPEIDMLTRVRSAPYNFGVDEALHQVEERVFPAGSYIAKTTSAVSAISGVTPGSGTAEIYEWSGSTLATTGIEVTVFNTSSTAVADDAWVQLKHDGCRLIVDVEDCDA